MQRVHKWFLAVVVLILAILLLLFSISPKKEESWATNPKDMLIETESHVQVDVFEATKGRGWVDEGNIQYRYGSLKTMFTFRGQYKGTFFKSKYPEEMPIIEITEFLDPTDGVAQAFIVENKENIRWKAIIFVDQEFKDEFENLYVLWGKEFQNQKLFNPKRVGNGIYSDFVYDDPNRFVDNIAMGGVLIGNAESNKHLENSTWIMMR